MLSKYWLHIVCLILIVLNVVLSLLYFTQTPVSQCESKDCELNEYIMQNTEDYLKYVNSIRKFFLQLSQVLVKDRNLRNEINNSEVVKNIMYTDETNSEFTAMVHFLHGASVSEAYKFDKSSFSKKYDFPSTISYVNANDPSTTGMNGITLFLEMLLSDIEKEKETLLE
jgi:hypothetical protein